MKPSSYLLPFTLYLFNLKEAFPFMSFILQHWHLHHIWAVSVKKFGECISYIKNDFVLGKESYWWKIIAGDSSVCPCCKLYLPCYQIVFVRSPIQTVGQFTMMSTCIAQHLRPGVPDSKWPLWTGLPSSRNENHSSLFSHFLSHMGSPFIEKMCCLFGHCIAA